MNFSGVVEINSPRDRVWKFLTDPTLVSQCVPDLDQMEVVDAMTFRAVVKAGIGVVRGKFGFEVTWQDLTEPSHARMIAKGKGSGSAVTMESTMDLADAGAAGTTLTWSADVVVHGMIASVGARLLDGFAAKQTEQVFQCIRAKLETTTSYHP
jgi:hypothetical protein